MEGGIDGAYRKYRKYISIVNTCLYGIYNAKPLGEECKLGSFFATIGRVVVKCTFLKKYILDIHSQQFGTILTVEDICWYWIYHANSVCTELGSVFLKMTICIGNMLTTIRGVCVS